MYEVTQVTSDPLQKQTLVLPDGSVIVMQLYYVQQQYGWFVPSLTYGSFTLKGLRITNNPNMLRQWKNLIPFGMACFSVGQREPSQIQDFSSKNSILYILSEAEVVEYERYLSDG